MKSYNFPSIGRPDYGYQVTSEYEYRERRCFSSYISEFRTFGDGMTQHSGCGGISIENGLDASVSLASAMASNPDPEFHSLVATIFPVSPNRQGMEFAFSVRHVEGKKKFFSQRERKISSSEKLQYDKRYTETNQRMDGSCLSVFRILSERHGGTDGLCVIELLEAIREYSSERGDGYTNISDELEQIGYAEITDMEIYRNLRSALEVIRYFVEASRKADIAKRCFSCLKNNYIDRLPPVAEAA